jgi:amphi-Trp domain-containing protein
VSESGEGVRLARRAAAEQLVDLAYALTTGEIELGGDGERVTIPIADEVTLARRSSREPGRVEVHLTLSWRA